jgi:hypothetical protein
VEVRPGPTPRNRGIRPNCIETLLRRLDEDLVITRTPLSRLEVVPILALPTVAEVQM